MQFRTEIAIRHSKNEVTLDHGIVTVGSCFADDIGQRFLDYKFRVSKNALGTVYNPISIHKILMAALLKEEPKPNGFVMRDGAWFHYDFHSLWFDKSNESLSAVLVREINKLHEAIKNSRYLFITYGTSWVYELVEGKEVVANCHKIPQSNFEKFPLTQKRIVESFGKLHHELNRVNPDCRIILTVSPVRHIKDTLELNSVSKSILRLTCHTLAETFYNVEYFPAYEIMMDDLRDYRFYEPDLIHPSEVAVEYIWEKFCEAYLSNDTRNFLREWRKIKSAIEHKPFQVESNAHQQFLKDTLEKLIQLEKIVDVRNEIAALKSQLL
jgi:hypothetical protein